MGGWEHVDPFYTRLFGFLVLCYALAAVFTWDFFENSDHEQLAIRSLPTRARGVLCVIIHRENCENTLGSRLEPLAEQTTPGIAPRAAV